MSYLSESYHVFFIRKKLQTNLEVFERHVSVPIFVVHEHDIGIDNINKMTRVFHIVG